MFLTASSARFCSVSNTNTLRDAKREPRDQHDPWMLVAAWAYALVVATANTMRYGRVVMSDLPESQHAAWNRGRSGSKAQGKHAAAYRDCDGCR